MKSEVGKIKKVDKINRKMERFYSALGQFNTNMVTMLRNDPGKVDEITDLLTNVFCPAHAEECQLLGPNYMWDEGNHSCNRKPSENELPEGGGGN